jgi:hypothetical protein
MLFLLFGPDMQLLDALDDDQKSQEYWGAPYHFTQSVDQGDGVNYFYYTNEKQRFFNYEAKLEIFKIKDKQISKDETPLKTTYGFAALM